MDTDTAEKEKPTTGHANQGDKPEEKAEAKAEDKTPEAEAEKKE